MKIYETWLNNRYTDKEGIRNWCLECFGDEGWSVTSHYNERIPPLCPFLFATENEDQYTLFIMRWS